MLELELKKYKSRYNCLVPLKDTKENFIKVLSSFSSIKSGSFYATNISLLDYTQPILTAKLVSVKEDTPAVVIDNIKFSSRLGEAADAL